MGQQHSGTKQTNAEEDLPALVKDLELNGKPLATPRMHPVDWKPQQMFTAEDDPDRTRGFSWRVPKFVTEKDPIRQRDKLTVEEIDLESIGVDPKPNARWPYPSFARVVNNILEPEECEELLSSVNEKGTYFKLVSTLITVTITEYYCHRLHPCIDQRRQRQADAGEEVQGRTPLRRGLTGADALHLRRLETAPPLPSLRGNKQPR